MNAATLQSVRQDLAGASVFALVMAAPAIIGDHASPLRAAAASLLIAVLSVIYGRSAARLLALPRREPLTMAFVIVAGFAAVSLVHLTATAALRLGAVNALWIDALIGSALLAIESRSRRLNAASVLIGTDDSASAIAIDLVAFVAVAALASVWARETVRALSHAQTTGEFRAWQDYFLHATEITYIRDYATYGGQSLYLRGLPQPFYHRASYAMPALFSSLSGSPSVMAATAFWLPLGLTLCGISAYGLGSAIAGRAGGVAAVAALFLMPDPSRYWFANPWFSFFWLVQTGGGSGYAMAMTMSALGLLLHRTSANASRRVIAAVLLAAGAAFFRVHVAALGVPLVGSMALMIWPASARKKLIAVGVAAVVGFAVAAAFEQIALAPHFFSARPDRPAFFAFVLAQAPDQGAFYARLGGNESPWGAVTGLALTLVEAFGATLPAAMLLAIARGRGALDRRAVVLVSLVPAWYGMVVLLMPTPAYGDYTEYGHRAFVLAYAVLAVVAGAAVARRVVTLLPNSHLARIASTAAAVMIASGAVVVVPWRHSREIQQRWGPQFSVIPLTNETIGAAAYVREHSSPGEVALASNEDPRAIFVALAERPAFVSRTDLFRRLGGTAAQLAATRAEEHAQLARIVDSEQRRTAARAYGISWFIVDVSDGPQWSATAHASCSYCGASVRVFDLR